MKIQKLCTNGQWGQWQALALQETKWKTCTCSHGVLLQTGSSSFCWYDKGIPGNLLLTGKHSACSLCVSAVLVFSLSNFFYPRGFYRAFAQILLCIILAWSHQQGSDHTCKNMHMHWYICTQTSQLSPDRMEMFIQTMGRCKGLPPLEQTTYNTARQHNTHCFQQELPTPLLTQLWLAFHLMLSKPAKGEFSYALLNTGLGSQNYTKPMILTLN